MTERERMDKGLVYDCSSEEIMTEQTKHVGYMKEYNTLGLGDEKRMEELFAYHACRGRREHLHSAAVLC